jgi:protein-disulfide isomerase
MQKLRSLLPLLVPAVLTACVIAPPADHRDVVDIEPKTASGAEQSSIAATVDVGLALRGLDGPALSATGSMRFLQSGILEFGPAEAPHTLTVFTEYHCAYCNEFNADMLPELRREFAETGRLKIRIVPVILAKYPNSTAAAQALLCAGKTGSGSAMHTLLSERENKHRSSVLEYAEELHIEPEGFLGCLDAEETKTMLAGQKTVIDALKITLVPTFILDDEVRTGLPFLADLRGWIESKE